MQFTAVEVRKHNPLTPYDTRCSLEDLRKMAGISVAT